MFKPDRFKKNAGFAFYTKNSICYTNGVFLLEFGISKIEI
jgi:hypothetical protein